MSSVGSMLLKGDHGLQVVDAEGHHGVGAHAGRCSRVVINSQFGTLTEDASWFL